MILQLVMMYNSTVFCYKRFSRSEEIVWTNIYVLNIGCDLDQNTQPSRILAGHLGVV